MTPHELFNGRTPNISYLYVFGCRAWVYMPKDQQKKWDANSQQMIFVGYESGSKAYCLWNPRTRIIIISMCVCFDKTTLPRKSVQSLLVISPSPPIDQSVHIPITFSEDIAPTPHLHSQPTTMLPTPTPTLSKIPLPESNPPTPSPSPPPSPPSQQSQATPGPSSLPSQSSKSDNEQSSNEDPPHTPPIMTVPVPSTPEKQQEIQDMPKTPQKKRKQKTKAHPQLESLIERKNPLNDIATALGHLQLKPS